MPHTGRIWQALTTPLRRARWAIADWSSAGDRAFHDELFSQRGYDPFSPSYPGYLTIRRFADLASARLGAATGVVDLGCGPGEITCELARRHADVQFHGIDHSEAAVARARELAGRARLTNIRFSTGDLETYTPDDTVGLIVMFDAFHHLLDPAGFVRRVGERCPRIFLIEPHGAWTGTWDKTSDLDWLPLTMQQIRHRLEAQLGVAGDEQVAGAAPAARPSPGGAAPTEHRYTLGDFEGFFKGWPLDVRGTIAGLEEYGLRATRRSLAGDRLGDISYTLVVSIEELLVEQEMDLGAKHWAIYADRTGAVTGATTRPIRHLRSPATGGLAPAYGVECEVLECPTTVTAGERFAVRLRLRNTGWLPWDSSAGQPVNASYRWLAPDGRVLVHDGLRTPLPSVVGEASDVDLSLTVQAPDAKGGAILAIDLVQEGVAWFSDQGVTPARVTIDVRRAAS